MLITLVIIGVVAALTIPNLMQKYQEQTTVKKVQKFYSNLSNAYNLAMKENGTASDWDIEGQGAEHSNRIYELLFKPYFKIAKNCGTTNSGNCVENVNYKYLNNSLHNNFATSNYYKAALDDGAVIIWGVPSVTAISGSGFYVYYDINGLKGPNQWSKDLFLFIVRNDKVFPAGIQSGEYSWTPFNSSCKTTSYGWGCTAWVVYKGNMDYLHCDLTWDKNSCKDK